MKVYQYRHMQTDEIVLEEEAKEYVKEKLGIQDLIPKGRFGTLTKEQLDYVEETIEWYFSGEWIKEEIKKESTNIDVMTELIEQKSI